MISTKSFFILLFIFSSFNLYSDEFAILLENYFGQREPSSATAIDLSQLQFQFEIYQNSPLDINKASIKKLKDLPLISEDVIKQLLPNKPFKSIAQLFESIDSLKTDKIIKYILKNCLAINPINPKELNIKYLARNQQVIQETKGFSENKYQGSNLNLYQKFNLNYDMFELFAVWDKDAGERNINDFQSYSIKYDDNISSVIIGDYGLTFGLGNLFDQSFINPKGVDFINSSVEFESRGFANKSTIESNYFRGIYGDYSLDINSSSKLKLGVFYSNFNRSATIDETTNIASSIYQSGYYRTDTEIEKNGNINEKLYGASAELRAFDFSIGIASAYIMYSNHIMSSSNSEFYGKEGLLSTIFGNYSSENYSLKMEFTNDARNYNSLRINSIYQIDESAELLLDLRYANPNYRAPYATNFGEQSFVANEIGILSGIAFHKNRWNVALFVDMFNSINRTFSLNQPMRGIQYFVDISKKIEKVNYGLRLNYERKSDAITIDTINSKVTIQKDKFRVRFDINTDIGFGYLFRARSELALSINNNINNFGNLLLFEIKKNSEELNLYYGISYTIFNTTSFESAIYGFQYQVPGFAYVYPYYLKGNNLSLFLKYKIADYLELWLRYNNLIRNDATTIGSGNDEIQGNTKTQLIFQLQYNLN